MKEQSIFTLTFASRPDLKFSFKMITEIDEDEKCHTTVERMRVTQNQEDVPESDFEEIMLNKLQQIATAFMYQHRDGIIRALRELGEEE